MTSECFNTWVRPLAFAGSEDQKLNMVAPNETFRKTLMENFAGVLNRAVAEIAGSNIRPMISVAGSSSETAGNETIDPLPVVQASALEVPTVRTTWLIDQLWADRAVGVIGGGPKLGKSWLALDIAVSIASGTPCLGTFKVHATGPVLLYAAEDSASALRNRIETLARLRNVDFTKLDVRVITAESLRLDKAGDQDRLDATIALHRPVMLVLDPLVRVHAIDENVAGQVASLLGYLRTLQRRSGVAIGLVHHVKKNVSPATGGGYSLRGSGDLYAWLDSFLYLRKNHDQLILSAEHRSAPGAGPFLLELAQPDTGPHLKLLSAEPCPTRLKTDALPEKILRALSSATDPMTLEALRQTLQVRNQRVVEAIRQLSSQGSIQRTSRGYTLVGPTQLPIQIS
ncbi:MAG: AAA family ATPase [Acidobacteria bacterium]|nr:AAA family ATPase [Acidobacteriota bacterium]